jgi:hypothetical protein
MDENCYKDKLMDSATEYIEQNKEYVQGVEDLQVDTQNMWSFTDGKIQQDLPILKDYMLQRIVEFENGLGERDFFNLDNIQGREESVWRTLSRFYNLSLPKRKRPDEKEENYSMVGDIIGIREILNAMHRSKTSGKFAGSYGVSERNGIPILMKLLLGQNAELDKTIKNMGRCFDDFGEEVYVNVDAYRKKCREEILEYMDEKDNHQFITTAIHEYADHTINGIANIDSNDAELLKTFIKQSALLSQFLGREEQLSREEYNEPVRQRQETDRREIERNELPAYEKLHRRKVTMFNIDGKKELPEYEAQHSQDVAEFNR